MTGLPRRVLRRLPVRLGLSGGARRRWAAFLLDLGRSAALRLASSLGRSLGPEARRRLKRLAALSPAMRVHMEESAVREVRRRMLSLGLVERGRLELERMRRDPDAPSGRRQAAMTLMGWHLDKGMGDADAQALDLLEEAAAGSRGERRLRAAVLGAEALKRAGRIAEARALLRDASEHPDRTIALANLEEDAGAKVALFDRAYEAAGLSGILLSGKPELPLFDRLEAPPAPEAGTGANGPLVSVIVPAFNSAATIATALRSLSRQTWRALEILVVDDASTDATREVVRDFAARRDGRVRLIVQPRNAGAYSARNAGLAEARGTFVTCHDADDWSHPEKIAAQVARLLRDPKAAAGMSTQARASSDLVFTRRGGLGLYAQPNMSSLMFRREPVLEQLGAWDNVRFAGDSDFLQRLRAVFGRNAVAQLSGFPLSFQRQAPGSLTTASASAYSGFMTGARLEYDRAVRRHVAGGGRLRFSLSREEARPFPAPAIMLPDRSGANAHFDVAIASDFRLAGGTNASNAEEIKAQRDAGLRTGLLHMPVFGLRSDYGFNEKVAGLIDGDGVQTIVFGQSVSCDLLILRHPWVLQDRLENLPSLKPETVKVIVNQPPSRNYAAAGDDIYDLATAADRCCAYFGSAGTWHPIGPLVRRALTEHHAADLAAIDLGDEDWPNIIDVEEWRRPPYKADPQRIRIGRHSRDNLLKWPEGRAALLAAYPDHAPFEIHVLGGADAPAATLGRLPRNWRVTPFGGEDPRAFLRGLDAFVYFTHPGWVEAFGRVIMEAMAVGVPAVLAPVYEPLFGDAALYCEPAAVARTVLGLVENEALYRQQVERARALVAGRFGHEAHRARIRPLLGGPKA